ncbi:MAG: zf-HC2 domain-containing protein [Acidobacteriota bacterium]
MEDRPYITCRELIEFLYLYLGGELPSERVAEFDRHLNVCPSCVAYIETYKETAALGRQAFQDLEQPVGTAVPEELVSAILSVRRKT